MEETPTVAILVLALLTAPAVAGGVSASTDEQLGDDSPVEDSWVPTAKLQGDPSTLSGSRTGADVALAGQTAVIGAPGEAAASVYQRAAAGWTLEDELRPDGPGGAFGLTVDADRDGDTLLVGAPASSSVYVFDRTGDGWEQTQRLTPDTTQSRDFFGGSVALDEEGSTAVVGAMARDTAAGDDAGLVYIFDREPTGWEQNTVLEPEDPQSRAWFGAELSLSTTSERLVVSSILAEDSVHTFDLGEEGWQQTSRIDGGGGFGVSVDLARAGTMLAVGDRGSEQAHLFEADASAWTKIDQVGPRDLDPASLDGSFGTDLALSADGGTLAVGSPGDDPSPGFMDSPVSERIPFVSSTPAGGSAYIFDAGHGGWDQTTKVAGVPGFPNDRFGVSLSMTNDGNGLLVGAPREDVVPRAIEDRGSAFVFSSVTMEGAP